MIQRIQTIYLLGAAILLALCFFLPVATLATATGPLDIFTFKGLTKGLSGKGLSDILSFVAGFAVMLTFGTIFFYKKRKHQIRMCYVSIGLLIVIFVLAFIQISILKNITGIIVSYKFSLVFPLISAVLVYLAYAGIKKDDELVRSYDRLR